MTSTHDFPWREVSKEAVRRWKTPLYVSAWQPVVQALQELKPLGGIGVPVRHWLSVKTHPMGPLLRSWRERLGLGLEVISAHELYAAQSAGASPNQIVVNGFAKDTWLPADLTGFNLHLDSLGETQRLGPEVLAKHRLGVRCAVGLEQSRVDSSIGSQFGVSENELEEIVDLLSRHGLAIEGLHFHLKSNIRDAAVYSTAVEHTLAIAERLGIRARYVDCGGGLPVPGQTTFESAGPMAESVDLDQLASSLRTVVSARPALEEVWFENGRFVTARSAVLIVRVIDTKTRDGIRYLICDGGRTNHALPADWEAGVFQLIPDRSGRQTPSVVCGPTCTTHDRLLSQPLPDDIRVGDFLVRFHAGAYYLSWETRFSLGLAAVVWCDEALNLRLARPGESPRDWWQWA